MKYILLPILKFLWALMFSLYGITLYIIYFILVVPMYIIWNFKFPDIKTDVYYNVYKRDLIIKGNYSPYWIEPKRSPQLFYGFKSIFHYIWNIK